MKNLKYIIFGFISILMLTSCEEVIELELDDETPRVVIEANLNATEGNIEVIVSRSNGFYEEGQQIKVDDAFVTLKQLGGSEFILDSNEDKIYILENIEVQSGEQYTVSIELDNEIFEATTMVPQEVELLKIDTSKFIPPFGGSDQVFYQMYTEWQDTPGQADFYRIKTYSNGIYETGQFILYNDTNADGNLFRRPIMQIFDPGNLYRIELLSMDKLSFEYIQELSTVQAQGGGSSVPFNPKGNFSNDALGYFGINYSSSIEVQL